MAAKRKLSVLIRSRTLRLGQTIADLRRVCDEKAAGDFEVVLTELEGRAMARSGIPLTVGSGPFLDLPARLREAVALVLATDKAEVRLGILRDSDSPLPDRAGGRAAGRKRIRVRDGSKIAAAAAPTVPVGAGGMRR